MRRILVIDDEDDIREITAKTLHATAGWEVDTASSGPDGIRRASSHCPDAVLLDVSMPGMDGPATLREMQATPSLADVPVIFLTARAKASSPDSVPRPSSPNPLIPARWPVKSPAFSAGVDSHG